MSELTEGIPRRLFIGPYPIETRYRGQVPLCGRCGEYGHRVATCSNDVECFKCGQNGHIQRQYFKCFLCGQFGHVRADCLENRRDVSNDRDDETSESNLSNDIGRDEDGSDVSRSSDEDMDPVEWTSCKDPGGIRFKTYPRKQDLKWSKIARIKRTAIALFLPKGEKKRG